MSLRLPLSATPAPLALELAATLACACACACGGSKAAAAGDAAADAAVDAAAARPPPPAPTAVPMPSTVGKHGTVSVALAKSGATVNARFEDETAPARSCTLTAVPASAACVVRECAPATGATTLASAGKVTVSAPKGAPVTLAPAAKTNVYPSRPWKVALKGGETLTVKAAGAKEGVPLLKATVTAPAPVLGLIKPEIPKGAPLVLHPKSDLPLSWPAGTAGGRLEIEITTDKTTVACVYPASDGSGSIPASALAKLAPGAGQLTANVRATSDVTQGAWKITVDATGSVAATPIRVE